MFFLSLSSGSMCRLFVGIAVAMALNTMLCAQTFSEEDFRI